MVVMFLLTFEQYKKNIYDKKHLNKSKLHFDTTLNAQDAFDLVSNPEKVSKHWFLPFVGFDKKIRKIKKHNGLSRRKNKIRPLRYSANKDGYIYTYYSYLLNENYENFIKETPLNDSVLAYRSLGKSNIHFAKEVFSWININPNCNVLTIDLSNFFDNLDHEIIKKQWKKISHVNQLSIDNYVVFRSITNYSFFYIEDVLSALGWPDKLTRTKLKISEPKILHRKDNPFHTSLKDFRNIRKNKINKIDGTSDFLIKKPEKKNGKRYGIPQGSPISAVLSNIYMLDFDQECCNLMSKYKGIYRRYCDDIILVFNQNVKIDFVYSEIEKNLEKYCGLQLRINNEKVEKIKFISSSTDKNTSIDTITKKYKPLQYLGFIYNGKKILIRSSSLSNYYRRLISKIRSFRNKAKQNKKIIYRRKIYRMFSHLARNKRNFISYAYDSSNIMNSTFIKKQLSSHWKRIHDELKK